MKKHCSFILSLFAAIGTLIACAPAPIQEQEQEEDPTENTGDDSPAGKSRASRQSPTLSPGKQWNRSQSQGSTPCRISLPHTRCWTGDRRPWTMMRMSLTGTQPEITVPSSGWTRPERTPRMTDSAFIPPSGISVRDLRALAATRPSTPWPRSWEPAWLALTKRSTLPGAE